METAQCDTGLVCLDSICTYSTPAPSTSRTALLLGLGILAAIAAVAIWRRRLFIGSVCR